LDKWNLKEVSFKINYKTLKYFINLIFDFFKAKFTSYKYKIAIAAVIIANKPENLTIEQYMQLFHANFSVFYVSNREQISQLKNLLFSTKKQLFIEQNKEILQKAQESQNKQENKKETSLECLFKNFQILEKSRESLLGSENITAQFSSNLDFLSNLIKLKTVEKSFRLNENSVELITQCLSMFINQIRHFYFERETKQTETKQTNCKKLTIPVDTLLHSLQVFLNVYDIEWLYYLRSSLIENIRQFVKDLIKFIINFPRNKKVVKFLIQAYDFVLK